MTSFYDLLDKYRVHLAGTTPMNELRAGIDKVCMAAAANGGPNALLSLPDDQIVFRRIQTPYRDAVIRSAVAFKVWMSRVYPGIMIDEEKSVWPTANRFREFSSRGRWDTSAKPGGRVCPACNIIGLQMILGYKMGEPAKIWTCPKCNHEIRDGVSS